jgi:hypothetical protein
MNTGILLKLSFISGFILTVAGAWLKIERQPAGQPLLVAALVLTLVFILTALYEVLTSRRISRWEKMLWTIAFILMSALTGLVYLLFERKRIVAGR